MTRRIARYFARVAPVCIAFALAGCGGGGQNQDSGCGGGPVFVNSTYFYPAGHGQVSVDFTLAPTNPPFLCNASNYAASSLPDGLNINAATGVISGRPTRGQTVNGTITLSSSMFTGSVTRSFSITIDPYPLAANGWTFMNAQSALPVTGPTYTAALGTTLYAFTQTSPAGNLQLKVMQSLDSGATWTTLSVTPPAVNRSAGTDVYEWLAPTSDGQSVYVVGYENAGISVSLATWRFDGSAWTKVSATQEPPRRGAFSVVANGGTLYLVGGGVGNSWNWALLNELNNTFATTNEVWRSTDQGANWALWSSSSSTLPPRAGHCSLNIGGQLYVYGGFDQTSQRTDLWTSSDGQSWTSVGTSGSFTPDASRANWIENCVAHNSRFYAAFDSSTWRNASGAQVGYFDLITGAWNDDGLLPISYSLDRRRFHPGMTSFQGKLYLVGGGCGPTSCSVGRDDAWSR